MTKRDQSTIKTAVSSKGVTGSKIYKGVQLERSAEHIFVDFKQPYRVLSSAVLNGGLGWVNHFLNMKVSKHCSVELEDPALTLNKYAQTSGRTELVVGMMTAASMNSMRMSSETVEDEQLVVMVTTGLENARRAGDSAEFTPLSSVPDKVGTINTAIFTTASLTDEALVEAITIATEAKSALLQELGVRSPVSHGIATGTGTDAIAIFSACGGQSVRFTGKHTLFGEKIATLTMKALSDSLQKDHCVIRQQAVDGKA